MEYIEDTQYFDEYALPHVVPPDAGKNSLIMKVMNMLQKKGKNQIMIYIIQFMLTFHHIKSKI